MEPRWQFNLKEPCSSLPALLFCPVRKRAHPHAMEKGLTKSDGGFLVLSSDKEMALRIGQRRDRKPVLLEISVQGEKKRGNPFYAFGDLFLANEILPQSIVGPPVSREELKARKQESREKEELKTALHAGTFLLDAKSDNTPREKGHKGGRAQTQKSHHKKARGKKRKGWKEEARKMRKGERRS